MAESEVQGKGIISSAREKEDQSIAQPTPLPSEELEPVQDHPENIMNLLVQSIGSAVTNRWGEVSVPMDEEEFKEFVDNFHNQPFLVDFPRMHKGAYSTASLEDLISESLH